MKYKHTRGHGFFKKSVEYKGIDNAQQMMRNRSGHQRNQAIAIHKKGIIKHEERSKAKQTKE